MSIIKKYKIIAWRKPNWKLKAATSFLTATMKIA